jgi:hypothetical protein
MFKAGTRKAAAAFATPSPSFHNRLFTSRWSKQLLRRVDVVPLLIQSNVEADAGAASILGLS